MTFHDQMTDVILKAIYLLILQLKMLYIYFIFMKVCKIWNDKNTQSLFFCFLHDFAWCSLLHRYVYCVNACIIMSIDISTEMHAYMLKLYAQNGVWEISYLEKPSEVGTCPGQPETSLKYRCQFRKPGPLLQSCGAQFA